MFQKKPRTPKTSRHKFIKISSPKMILHTLHCHSVADSLCFKSSIWVGYQLPGFHVDKSTLADSCIINKMILTKEAIDQWRKRLKPASTQKDNILNICYNFTCRLLYKLFFDIKAVFFKLLQKVIGVQFF